jgi:hypothetical protein
MALEEVWKCDDCQKVMNLEDMWGHGDLVRVSEDDWFQLLTHQKHYCWDCVKKLLKKPIYQLNGGHRSWHKFRQWMKGWRGGY